MKRTTRKMNFISEEKIILETRQHDSTKHTYVCHPISQSLTLIMRFPK